MTRIKIDYGIDLGTTNSSIARIENGKVVIKTNEGQQKHITPSCVHFNKKGDMFVGEKAINNIRSERLKAFQQQNPSLVNGFEEFKRAMGSTDVFKCQNMGRSYSPEELSAEVLKTLKSYIRDEDINAVVITVPAKFIGNQITATKEAAELAGFQHCILLQEPIAASIAYGIDSKTINGNWIVFDFGGGTFDAVLMKADEGIMKVVDTEGDNHLGGKNLDIAIVDYFIIPHLREKYSLTNILSDDLKKTTLQNALKKYAEELKINLSSENAKHAKIYEEYFGEDDNGNGIEIDFIVTKEQFQEIAEPIFQRAIDITNKLLINNKLYGSDLKTIILVGGPTYSNILQNMLKEQITPYVNTSVDPMTAVVIGATLFAATKEIPHGIQKKEKSKIQLKLLYDTDTVEIETPLGVRVNRDETECEIPDRLYIEIQRCDRDWSSGKVEIKDDAEILSLILIEHKHNEFEIIITDDKGNICLSEPNTFSIIQGFKIAGATLNDNLCVDLLALTDDKQLLSVIKGLNKNQPLPAKGFFIAQTQKDTRPGSTEDIIRIPLVYGEEGTRADLGKLLGEVIISGADLRSFLPKGSNVEVTVEVDESGYTKVSASFPYLDGDIVENVLETSKSITISREKLNIELGKANQALENLRDECSEVDIIEIEHLEKNVNELNLELEHGSVDSDRKSQNYERIREIFTEIDKLQSKNELPRIMQELSDALEILKDMLEQFGEFDNNKIYKQFDNQVDSIKSTQNLKIAKQLLSQIYSYRLAVMHEKMGVALEISWIKGFDDDFDSNNWTHKGQARQLINRAKDIIIDNRATKANLAPIMDELLSLLPIAEQPIIKPDDDILMR